MCLPKPGSRRRGVWSEQAAPLCPHQDENAKIDRCRVSGKCSCVFGHPGRSDGAVPVCQRHLSRSGSPGLKAKPNQNSLAWYQDVRMNFDAPAVLRKWPSLKDERVSSGCPPLLTVLLMSASGSSCRSPHPNVIYMRSTPLRRGELISAVLTTDQIVELIRLRDFL